MENQMRKIALISSLLMCSLAEGLIYQYTPVIGRSVLWVLGLGFCFLCKSVAQAGGKKKKKLNIFCAK